MEYFITFFLLKIVSIHYDGLVLVFGYATIGKDKTKTYKNDVILGCISRIQTHDGPYMGTICGYTYWKQVKETFCSLSL